MESSCMKYMLIIFNVLLFLVGGAVIGVGVYTLLTEFGAQEMSVLLGDELYVAGVYTLIVGGVVVIIIAFLGCCGAFIENKCILGFYGVLMLLTLICFIAVCILGFVFRGQIKVQLKKEAETTLIYKYGVDLESSLNVRVTKAWDDAQVKLKCCGVTGDVNSTRSWAVYKLNSTWFSESTAANKSYVPESCCKPNRDIAVCTGLAAIDGAPVLGPPINSSMSANDNLYTDGCYDKTVDHLDKYAMIIGYIGVATIIVMVLGLIFAFCLCRQLNASGYTV
ncbi:CD151 antigen-like [Gigantopelta aegis]|uniref:CD151 antigen-like n=1 Tax=Gigantopelta aegis TaxID=1735272 RepID=UPI001B889A7D|nr:CD151 antigen-like [Gigantopelta aegis]